MTIVLAACSAGDVSEQSIDQAPSETAASRGTATVDPVAAGQAVFDQICVACHTVQPPPNLAPPMMGIAGHYRDAFTDRDEAVAAMVAYIQSPDSAKSQLGAEAFRRFGIMAPLPLPEADLRAAAAWIWDMYDPEADPRPASERSSGQ
jgi:mono/diheme cytochrome c family protein